VQAENDRGDIAEMLQVKSYRTRDKID